MAAIAPGSQIVEVESQIRPVPNGHLMVGVQMPFAAVVSVAKLGEHLIDRWVAKIEPAAVSDNIRFPTAINAPPAIALEAQNPQAAMIRIVSALGTGAAAFILFPLLRPAVLLASAALDELPATRKGTGKQGSPHVVLVPGSSRFQ
jgi:hypothetical protein